MIMTPKSTCYIFNLSGGCNHQLKQCKKNNNKIKYIKVMLAVSKKQVKRHKLDDILTHFR